LVCVSLIGFSNTKPIPDKVLDVFLTPIAVDDPVTFRVELEAVKGN